MNIDVMIGVIGIVIMLILFLTGLEMAYCMALVGFFGFTFLMSFGPLRTWSSRISWTPSRPTATPSSPCSS